MSRLASCTGLALLLLGASFHAAFGQKPRYVQRLQLPVSRDDIGYGQAVTTDPHTDEVFVCDPRSNRILIFDNEGFFKFQILGDIEFSAPRDLAVDPDGLLLIIGNRGARQMPIELDFDGAFRQALDFAASSTLPTAPILSSIALSVDGESIYLADNANLRLWILDRRGELRASVDLTADLDAREAADMFLGQVDVYGDSVLLAVPSHGEIQRYDPKGRFIERVGVKGGGACELGRPTAAALAETGDYLIIDQQRMVLLRWSADGNRCLGEHLSIGLSPGFLYYPYDLALAADGRLYIAQTFDGRVQVYEDMPSAAGPKPRSLQGKNVERP